MYLFIHLYRLIYYILKFYLLFFLCIPTMASYYLKRKIYPQKKETKLLMNLD